MMGVIGDGERRRFGVDELEIDLLELALAQAVHGRDGALHGAVRRCGGGAR